MNPADTVADAGTLKQLPIKLQSRLRQSLNKCTVRIRHMGCSYNGGTSSGQNELFMDPCSLAD